MLTTFDNVVRTKNPNISFFFGSERRGRGFERTVLGIAETECRQSRQPDSLRPSRFNGGFCVSDVSNENSPSKGYCSNNLNLPSNF